MSVLWAFSVFTVSRCIATSWYLDFCWARRWLLCPLKTPCPPLTPQPGEFHILHEIYTCQTFHSDILKSVLVTDKNSTFQKKETSHLSIIFSITILHCSILHKSNAITHLEWLHLLVFYIPIWLYRAIVRDRGRFRYSQSVPKSPLHDLCGLS